MINIKYVHTCFPKKLLIGDGEVSEKYACKKRLHNEQGTEKSHSRSCQNTCFFRCSTTDSLHEYYIIPQYLEKLQQVEW